MVTSFASILSILDAEKQTVVSLQLMAGGPVAAFDLPYFTIGNDMKYYTNAELACPQTRDGFSRQASAAINSTTENNEIWYGQMTNGDYVLGIFNRNDNSNQITVDFSTLGIQGREANPRNLGSISRRG